MIRIKSYSQKMIDEYVDIMIPLIQHMYENNVPDDNDIKDLFSSNGQFDVEKVKDILKSRDAITNYSTQYSDDKKRMIEKIINYSLLEKSSSNSKGHWPEETKGLDSINNVVREKKNPQSEKIWAKVSGLRHKLLIDLNCLVCPYCNRQYVTSYIDSKEKTGKTTADLDHFRPKSEYPLLALSLYNFIPSCLLCNRNMKGQKNKDLIYPYDEYFVENCIFKLIPTCADDGTLFLKAMKGALSNNDDILKFKLILDSSPSISDNLKNKINNCKKVFHLEEVYQTHTKYAVELLQKKAIFDDGEYKKLIESSMRNVGLLEPKQEITQEELETFLYGFNWNDDGEDPDKPLSKLAYDIVKR